MRFLDVRFLAPFLGCLSILSLVRAIGQDICVTFNSTPSAFSVVRSGKAAPFFISEDEWPGVQRTAGDFVSDVEKVTGVSPNLMNVTSTVTSSTPPVIIGTLGRSSLISAFLNYTGLDVSSISGSWEAFMTKEIANPLPGISSAYVIIGADKRGTIYAMYDLSEQFGVSPWYWWADVPTTQNSDISIQSTGCSHGEPTIKYRGIFLNDEQPALQNWAMEKFTNGTGAALTGSPFNHFFYTKLFELILRLKGNYLWPVVLLSTMDQFPSAFGVDDTQNQPLADWYGIVMGTSHEEPMMRSIPVEWGLFGIGPWDYSTNSQNISNFWVNGTIRAKPYENIFTVGMRGDGDLSLPEGSNIAVLEKVISDQRQILMEVYNETDVTNIPQMWALYKEVLGYYYDGLQPPDDVTLLWSDDNWGNMIRLPVPSEFNRTGGAGVYYHYDYVGDPRDYKWITTFEQLSFAIDRQATRIWILNVGDLKPYELNTEFFLAYGWNSSRWRKPELLNGTTFSLTDYREAENVVTAWDALVNASTKIYNSLSSDFQPAFFETVQHPILASSTLTKMWVSQGINDLRVSQARLSANDFADQVEELFEQDYELETEYHQLLDGKWDQCVSSCNSRDTD
ncbi:hypothetical protein DFH11DRAFT_1541146 [Phellopilus nigrolimitatus]|nr:hypothetical protein DFH11DRAFT_1541146 [Phellopilus nigrolimitatus]